MAFRNTSQIVPGFPAEALMKFGQGKRITSNGLATFASPRPRTLAAGLFVVFLFCVSGQFSKAWAIDIYHFLVEFKNGRIVERIFPVNSPLIQKIVVKKQGDVRRAKLYYLRLRKGKKATKVKEKIR